MLFVCSRGLAGPTSVTSIPWSQLGAAAQKKVDRSVSQVSLFRDGVKLKAEMQDMEGEVTSTGLWLTSTSDEEAGQAIRFRILATGITREGSPPTMVRLPDSGRVCASKDGAAWVRRDLVEEYSVSTDGIRQDFILARRPAGSGALRLNLALEGGNAVTCAYGVRLTLHGTGREIAYSRLRVTDADGNDLEARIEATAPNRLVLRVDDEKAVYPVRIDPTFSDADWVSLSQGFAGAAGPVKALAFDAAGNLYVGGSFSMIGNLPTNNIAKWDGSSWSALGNGVGDHSGDVRALAFLGSHLYVGGVFQSPGQNIARWSGSGWLPVAGLDGPVNALVSDGASTLYIGGDFTGGVARLSSSSVISPLGSGVNNGVEALALSGTSLFVGGDFTAAGGVAANSIAIWNTSAGAWSAIGSGIEGAPSNGPVVKALAVIGTTVYAGGRFTTAGGVAASNLARWDGSSWSPLGGGISTAPWWGEILEMSMFGSDLLVGGSFSSLGGLNLSNFAKWNGTTWSSVGSAYADVVGAMAVRGSDVYVASDQMVTLEQINSNPIRKWNGSSWSSVGPGMDGHVLALKLIDDNLYVGGDFSFVNGIAAGSIVKWNGSVWTPLGPGVSGWVRVIENHGTDIYVGGYLTSAGSTPVVNIAKWNGTAWSALGEGLLHDSMVVPPDWGVFSIAFDDSNVYAGGTIVASGSTPIKNVARWDGSGWTGLGVGRDGYVRALAVHGGQLYAGGNGLARWDGTDWLNIASGTFHVLQTHGGDLYAGGAFTSIGGISAGGISKWNGGSWTSLGNSGTGPVLTMSFAGDTLFVGGSGYIARWNGVAWSPMGSGATGGYGIRAITANPTHLYAGGSFHDVGGKFSPFLAQANIPATTALQDWRQTYFGTVSRTGDAADDFDADNDGLPNLLEWACGLHPTQSDTLPVIQTQNGTTMEFTYTRSVEAVNAGTLFTVEWTDSLQGTAWSTSGVTQSVLTDNGTTQQVKATLPAGTSGRRFVRLKVTAGE
jgi:hypothetical protein